MLDIQNRAPGRPRAVNGAGLAHQWLRDNLPDPNDWPVAPDLHGFGFAPARVPARIAPLPADEWRVFALMLEPDGADVLVFVVARKANTLLLVAYGQPDAADQASRGYAGPPSDQAFVDAAEDIATQALNAITLI